MKNSIPSPLTIGRFGTHYLITYPTPIAGDQSATAILAECGSLERAELIVQAVNSHQALVDALRDCITDPNAHCLTVDTRDALFRRLEAINQTARQALALATK